MSNPSKKKKNKRKTDESNEEEEEQHKIRIRQSDRKRQTHIKSKSQRTILEETGPKRKGKKKKNDSDDEYVEESESTTDSITDEDDEIEREINELQDLNSHDSGDETPLTNPTTPIISWRSENHTEKEENSDDDFEYDSYQAEIDSNTREYLKTYRIKFLQEFDQTPVKDRYWKHRKVELNTHEVKKILGNIPNLPSADLIKIVKTISRNFLSQIIAESRLVMSENDEFGSILPSHIREAFRRMSEKGQIPWLKKEKFLD
ncbi:transcription initiation factor tfiid subunit 11 [Anaeramoeba ignava]|uniref:Transcription initiation factor tfiid subunit 11 n=1 Tax=Anaeramoeba ignava TaxID=1746090 RepID=A0A9Q0RH20_ANAIG|nr:transcription initiation factor tfiid subunit 11 [Anaeramoeba ignava]